MRYRGGYNTTYTDDESVYSKSGSRCCSKKVVCSIVLALLMLVVVAVAATLFVAFIIAILLQEPIYADSATMQRIYDQPNMTGSNYQKLPAILGFALSFPTIVNATGEYDVLVFQKLRDYLQHTFHHVFNSPYVQVTDRFPSFLLTVQDPKSNNNNNNNSFLLAGHIDVVPVDVESWDDDPFSGAWLNKEHPDQGYVYGRGAIDDKTNVIAILCALDELLESGWSPNTTFYVAIGHDEEVLGRSGALELAKVLQKRGVHDLFFVLDEGMPIVDGLISGVNVPVATIGVSEKGWMSLRVEAVGPAGHSSIPPRQQATHTLATALHNLHSNPHPTMLGTGPEEDMLRAIAPKSEWPYRLAMSNPWLFRLVLSAVMSKQKETDALQRTTTATTIVRAGVKDNVVPGSAWAVVNHRVHPGQTLEQVLEHDIRAIGDESVNVTVLGTRECAPVSPYGPESSAFCLIAATVKKIYPTAVPAPSLLLANTDTVHYLQFSRNVYRFLPLLLTAEDIRTVHGHNERISAANIWRAAQFYQSLILSADGAVFTAHSSPSHVRLGEL